MKKRGSPRAPLGSSPQTYIRSPPLPAQSMVTTSQPSNKLRKFERAQEGGGSKENCEVSSGGRVMGSEAVLAVV